MSDTNETALDGPATPSSEGRAGEPFVTYGALLDNYATAQPWTDAEKTMLALSQLLIGHDHYGKRMPDENTTLLLRIAYEGARRAVAERGGSGLISANDAGPDSIVQAPTATEMEHIAPRRPGRPPMVSLNGACNRGPRPVR